MINYLPNRLTAVWAVLFRQFFLKEGANKMMYVSLYETEQVYGGPEEGGWWHTFYTYIETLSEHETREEAIEACVEKRKEWDAKVEQRKAEQYARTAAMPEGPDPYPDTEGYIPRGWGDGGNYKIIVERRAGSRDNNSKGIPHYE